MPREISDVSLTDTAWGLQPRYHVSIGLGLQFVALYAAQKSMDDRRLSKLFWGLLVSQMYGADIDILTSGKSHVISRSIARRGTPNLNTCSVCIKHIALVHVDCAVEAIFP